MPSWLKTAFVYGAGFVGAIAFATACDPSYGITSFRCDPSSPDCPTQFGSGGSYVCCSDDASAINFAEPDATALPGYAGGGGIPLFSGAQNVLSSSGFCIDTSLVPPAAAIPEVGAGLGCPLPCNPTWSDADIATVCGNGSLCCATVELEPEDCVFDGGLGDAGCWRPVTGRDISGLGGVDATDWSGSAHATHQDPSGAGCMQFVAAAAGEIVAAGLSNDDALAACYRRLSVSNQRGYCGGGDATGQCPLANPGYRDACEQMNDLEARTNCG